MAYVIRTKTARIELDGGNLWVEMRPHVTAGEWNDLLAEYASGEFRNNPGDLTLRVMQILITDWGGFVDEDEQPIPCTPANIAALNPQSWVYQRLQSETADRMGDTDPKDQGPISSPSLDAPRE